MSPRGASRNIGADRGHIAFKLADAFVWHLGHSFHLSIAQV